MRFYLKNTTIKGALTAAGHCSGESGFPVGIQFLESKNVLRRIGSSCGPSILWEGENALDTALLEWEEGSLPLRGASGVGPAPSLPNWSLV